MRKPKILLVPQTLYREDCAGLSATHCQSNNATSELSDEISMLLMKACAITRQFQGPSIDSASVFTRSTGLANQSPLPVVGCFLLALRRQGVYRSSMIATLCPDQRQNTLQQPPRSVPKSCDEMSSRKCENPFRLLFFTREDFFHWELLKLDYCLVIVSKKSFLKKDWMLKKGFKHAFSKKKQIVLDTIDIQRKSRSEIASRKHYANEFDSLMVLHKETVTTTWDSWRKNGKWNWE